MLKMLKSITFFLLLTLSFFSSLRAEDNLILPCENSLETLEWDLKFIERAEKSIEFAGCYTGGDIFQKFLVAFEGRLEKCPKLEVFILANPVLFEKNDHASVARLKKQYGSRFHIQFATPFLFPFPNFSSTESHVKCLIVDETYFSGGGTNFHISLCSEGTTTPKRDIKGKLDGMLPSGGRDQDIVGKGPIAKDLRIAFHKLFALWDHVVAQGKYFEKDPEVFGNGSFYRPISEDQKLNFAEFETKALKVPDSKMKLILGHPVGSLNPITKQYCELVESAREEIVIANLYFNPISPLFKSLLNASNRGINIELVTNGCGEKAPHFNQYVGWATRVNYVPLFYGREWSFGEAKQAENTPANQVKIYEYEVEDILYHKKIMVVDRRYVVIGSYNLSFRSDRGDYEIVFVIDSKEVAQKILKVIERDKGFSLPISPTTARKWYFDFDTALKGAFQKQFNGILG